MTAKPAEIKTSTRRIIWTCSKCGVKTIDYTATRHLSYVDKFGNGRYGDARLTRVVDGVTRHVQHDLACPTCGSDRRGTEVKGHVTEHKCNAKCLASKSGVCECSCGGKNHGSSYC